MAPARPRGRAEAAAIFGDPTGGGRWMGAEAAPAWRKANIVELHGPDAIPGLERFYFQCHKLLEPQMREAFARANAAAPGYITRAASFVFRRVRHDAKAPLSYHAWGIAVDVDSAINGGRALAAYPEPWSPEWLRLWPRGVPPGVVEAFEGVGFRWGGRWHGYVDPMHFEWVG